MKREESVPVPQGWTGGAAWKGAGASVLLHLFVGAAMIGALSGPPKAPPQVIDLTILPPAEATLRPVPPAIIAAVQPSKTAGAAVHPGPPALPAPHPAANPPNVNPPDANPPDATAPANPSDPAATGSAPAPGSSHPLAAGTFPPGRGPVTAAVGSPSGASGAGSSPAGDFGWIREAIQGAIAYPATARRMGWEGKVVVAFQLLSDGSVRDVRIVEGSGHAALDRGAIEAVRNASPFPRSPVEAVVITPVVYRLTTR